MRIKVNWSVAKICLLGCRHCTFVAVDLNGFLGRADVLHVCRISAKVNHRLAVKQHKIRVDGLMILLLSKKNRWVVVDVFDELGKNDHTFLITSIRGIINSSGHGMNLRRRRLGVRAHTHGMSKLAASLAANVGYSWL
jgi:hypothetical protein